MSKLTGFCKFCGQASLLADEEIEPFREQAAGNTEVLLTLAATNKCGCIKASKARRKAKCLEDTDKWIKETFSENEPLGDFMRNAVESVVDLNADKVSVRHDRWSYSIALDKDGCVKIHSTYTHNNDVSIGINIYGK